MKPRELCEKAWQEIAGKFPDFKIISKGQTLKKISKNKDLAYEIYFQANRNNYECSVEFVPHIYIYSKGKYQQWFCIWWGDRRSIRKNTI